MTLADNIRLKLEKKVFDKLGSDCVIHTKVYTTDEWGDKTEQSETTQSTKAVPYYVIDSQRDEQEAGTVEKGEFELALPYEITITKKDIVAYNGKMYDVFEIRPYPLANQNILNIVTVKEQI